MEKTNINKNDNDFTEFSVLKDLDILDKRHEQSVKRKNESEFDLEIKDDLIEYNSKTGRVEFEEIDYELFKQNLEKENFHVNLQNYMKKGENINKSNNIKRNIISDNYKERKIDENEENKEENSREDFIPWILVVVGSLILISVIKKTFTE